jgi:hypothetical protein
LEQGGTMLRGFAFGAALIATAGCVSNYPALASSLPNEGEFVYSSLCVERESGDTSGYRVKLLRSANGDRLYLEWSEGPLYGPMLATDLVIDPNTSGIAFTIPAHTPPSDISESLNYSGQVSTESLSLNGSLVPRVKSSDGQIGPCK